MTHGDHIRSMTDPELAEFITDIIMDVQRTMARKLSQNGIPITIVETPYVIMNRVLLNLKKPIEEEPK